MVKYTNLKYNIIPISPVHIGSGEVMDPFRFIVKDGYAHLVNTQAYTSYLTATDKATFTRLLDGGVLHALLRYLWDCFDSRNEALFHYRYPVKHEIVQIFKAHLEGNANQNLIYSFIRTGLYQPLIPGSSIKGSFRTAVISALYDKAGGAAAGRDFEYMLLGATNERGSRQVAADPFRFIRFSDAPLTNKHLEVCKIERVYTRVDRPSAPVYAEVLKPNIVPVTSTVLSISKDFLDNERIAGLFPDGADANQKLLALADIVNEYYRSRILKDRESITNPRYRDVYNGVLEQISRLNKGHFILRIGKGSGRNFLSVNNPDNPIPITKSVAEGKTLGWCILKFTLE